MGVAAGGRFAGMRGICLLAALLWPAGAVHADDLREELTRFLYDDASAVVHLRTYYLDRTNPPPPNNVAWAGGGWVGLQTGWLYDTIQLGAVGYTSQPLWAPPQTDGTLLLKTGQYGFFVLGQAYASVKIKEQVFTAYRQEINELEVNPHDDRMVPNMFEAYALRGQVGPVNYFAGYVAAMKPRDYSSFLNMAERAGAPNVNAGMLLGSLKYGNVDKLQARASIYDVPDILTSGYADVGGTIPVVGAFSARPSAQFMVQGSNGSNLLTGKPFSTFAAGLRLDLLWHDATLWGAFTQTGSAAAYLTPYGQWIGYSHQLTKDFDRAGERAFQVGVAYDFTGVGLPGTVFFASATFGDRAINPANGAALSQNNEYDLDLTVQLASQSAPEWLKPLQLRGRAGYIDQFFGGTVTSITDYRLILNYEWTVKTPRRH